MAQRSGGKNIWKETISESNCSHGTVMNTAFVIVENKSCNSFHVSVFFWVAVREHRAVLSP